MSSKSLRLSRTTTIERLLLMTLVVLMPLEGSIPTVGGYSILFLMFGVLGGYLVLCRLSALERIARHPVFLAGFALIGVGIFMETVHESNMYSEVFRLGFMFLAALLIASICRDRKALLVCLYGILLASLSLSAVLFLTTFTTLKTMQSQPDARVNSGDSAKSFRQATLQRKRMFTSDVPIGGDINKMAFYTTLGTVVAFALVLETKSVLWRYMFLASGVFCLIATFLPMSRGALVNLFISGAAVSYAHGILRPKAILLFGIFGIVVLVLVPDSAFQRFDFTTEKVKGEYVEGRARIYSATFNHLPEYILTGVGIKDFWGEWGRHSGFAKGDGISVSGAHNCYMQITIYWGLAGLGALLAMMWQAYRSFPKPTVRDPLRLCLVGFTVAVLVWSLAVHTFYGKEFSIAIGLIVACSCWIWPHLTFQQRVNLPRYRPPILPKPKTFQAITPRR